MQVPCVNQNTCITPPIHALKDLKKALSDSAVGYLDKNNGLLFVACPVWYWHRNKAMFLDDTRHYHAIPELAPTIMEGFRAFHTKLGLARFHKFDNTKSVPYSYILVKAKDINRSRPIVSYFNHPLKKTFNYASRGLSFILKNSNMRSFTLWACKDMTSTLKKYQRDMRTLFGANTRLMAYCSDI